MKFDDYIKEFYKNNKNRPTFDNLRFEFINKGYEKFLWLPYSEERVIEEKIEMKIRSLKELNIPKVLTPIVKTISEQSSNDEFIFFFSYAPTKRYYLAKELAKRAYKTIILPNVYEDDPSINTMAIFKKKQVKEAYLFYHSLRGSGMGNDMAAYRIFGVDILFIADLCSFKDQRICFPRPNPLTHFYGNMSRRDNDPYEIKQTREIIDEIMIRKDFKDEFVFAYTLRKFLMETMQSLYERNKEYFIKKKELGKIELNHKDEFEKIYSELVAKNEAPVKWKSEKQLFDLVYSEYPDTLFQHMPLWLAPQNLDIYVPSLKLGIEYQGIQHYEQVGFFGGEEGLEKRKKLDEKKRHLCKMNGITLLEWHYQDTITKPVLKKKLKELGLG
ncbi:hypothetical protein M3610_10435 [Neobacillus sp. MER 74]|uniref:hypothetical protein n=1 Tax=Neobacillus sp. MER 74 TaxID=2939566 RepID=UPI00203CFD2F|nr:hypothetical protein [Neobacillus sp. MER 74]MCM3115705.1 hypothetical protein [Neobacillus sp. MER 74]